MKAFLTVGVALWAAQGWAEPTYPAQVAESWPAITYTGQGMECRLCHFSPRGGDRDVVFGAKFERSGKAGQTAARLKALFEAKSDVDGDGCPDFDEMSAKPQTDPNDKSKKPENCPAEVPKPDAGVRDAGAGGGSGGGGNAGGGAGGGGGTSMAGGGAGGPMGSAGGGSAVPKLDGGTQGVTRLPDPGGCSSTGFGGFAVSVSILMLLWLRQIADPKRHRRSTLKAELQRTR
jgi:hypothetical protein